MAWQAANPQDPVRLHRLLQYGAWAIALATLPPPVRAPLLPLGTAQVARVAGVLLPPCTAFHCTLWLRLP
eukprot:7612295-Pyramimonas_sp.AAC.1